MILSRFQIQRFAFASFLAAWAWLLPASGGAADRPNILWITCEDINPQLGGFGDNHADTNSYVARQVENMAGSNSEQQPAPKKRPNSKK